MTTTLVEAYQRRRLALTAQEVEEFAFDPRQPRDKDGKWTVSVQHVTSQANAEAIAREGFRLDGVMTWSRHFGPGVYFSESGDRNSAKFYSRQGHGRTTGTSQVITAQLSLRNPLHVDIRTHSDFRQQATTALGGKERLVELAQAKYDKNVEVSRRILSEKLEKDNPEAFKALDLSLPEQVMLWDFNEAVVDRALGDIERETGGVSLFDLGYWRALATNPDDVLRSVSTESDNNVHQSANIAVLLRDEGYDGIVINSQSRGGVGGTQVVAFDTSAINVTNVEPYDRRRRRTVSASAVEEFYSPSQPRDQDGKWTTSGMRFGSGFGGMSAHPEHRVKPKTRLTAEDFSSKEALREAISGWWDGDLPNGHKSVVTTIKIESNPNKASSSGYGEATITGKIYNKHGDVAGDFERTLRFNENAQEASIGHDSFDMYLTAGGVGSAFNVRAVNAYRAAGIDRVETYAAQEVGGYAWAREGFRAGVHDYGYGVGLTDSRQYRVSELIQEADRRLDMWSHFAKHPVYVVEDIRKQLHALERASDAGEDVQPIHIASIGERTHRFKERSLAGVEYDTWPGKEMLLGQNWPGVYYFDANSAVTAAANRIEEFYSPSQPRDQDGKWTLGGVRTGSGFGGMSAHPDRRVKPTSKLTVESFKDEATFRAAVSSWFEGDLGGGYRAEIKHIAASNRSGAAAVITGTIKHQYGTAGHFARMMSLDDNGDLIVHHTSFDMEEGDRASGVGSAFIRKSVEAYRANGVDRVELEAGDRVGGYAWAREGFRERNGEMEDLFNRASDTIERMSKYGSPEQKAALQEAEKQLNVLVRAYEAGEDVQPIHIASIGERTKFKEVSTSWEGDKDIEYDSWIGKESLLGSNWHGVYYFDANNAITAAAKYISEFYSPTQPRDKEGQWTRHRGSITSLSRDTIDRALDKGIEGIFPHGSDTGTTPWPRAPRLKSGQLYDKALVAEALRKPPVLEPVDPRILYSTQPGLVRSHVEYYLGDEYKRSGKTAADQGNAGNQFPVVYVNSKGQHFILAGHHRAASALLRGEELDAIVVREP